MFADSLLGSSLFVIINFFDNNADKDFVHSYISLFSQFIVYVVLSICERRNFHRKFRKNLLLLSRPVLVLILVLLIILSGLSAILSANTSDAAITISFVQVFTVMLIALSLAIIITLLVNTISKTHYEQTATLLEDKMESQLKYYRMLDEKNTEIRKFRHDFKNHMLCVKSMLEVSDYEEAIYYINTLTQRFEDSSPIFSTGNYIADSILTVKNQECINNRIELIFSGIIPQNKLKSLDLCIILSNALDNAIEACMQITDDSPKRIVIVSDLKRHHWFLRITNTARPRIQILNDSVVTTKKDYSNHGFGLQNIKETVDKYSGDFLIHSEDSIFTLEITMNLNAKQAQS